MTIEKTGNPVRLRHTTGFGFSRRGVLFLAALALFSEGCGQPTETTRDNRRLLDAVLTAVTIRNLDELAKDKQLLDEREEAGLLSEESHAAIQEAIDMAQANDWDAAECELYAFRERTPFPK